MAKKLNKKIMHDDSIFNPKEYTEFLQQIKDKISLSQYKAFRATNNEMILSYWKGNS